MQPCGRSPCPLPIQAPPIDGSCDAAIGRRPRVDHYGHEPRRAAFNVEALPLEDLRQFQKDLAKVISTHEERHATDARAKLDLIAEDIDFSLADLIGTEVKSTRAPTTTRYRHRENPGLPSSGCGSNTLWLVAALYSGKLPDDLMEAMTCSRNQALSFLPSRKDRL